MARVLVLDDERAICEAFEQLLTGDGHSVATLDKQHDDGEIDDNDYNTRRSALTQAALTASKTEAQPT